MEKVEKLEAAVGKSVEQWNVEDLDKFSLEENLECLQLLKDSAVISECLERSKGNEEVANILVPLFVKSKLTNSETFANTLLEKHEKNEISDEDLVKELDEMIVDESPYNVVVGALVKISMFPDHDFSEVDTKIKQAFAELKEVLYGIWFNPVGVDCFTLVADVLDVLFPLRSKYFAKTGIDILDDEDNKMKLLLDEVHQYEESMKKFLEELATNEDIPEELKEELKKASENPSDEGVNG